MKKKTSKKTLPTPEYDSKREQTILLEDMRKDIKAIAEGHGVINQKLDDANTKLDDHGRRLDKVEFEIQNIKSELMVVKLSVKDVDQRTIKLEAGQQKLEAGQQKLEAGQQRIEQKLDTVTTDYEQRLAKLEVIR